MLNVVLGTGQRVSLGAYVAGIKAVCAADPSTEYSASLEHWAPSTAREIRAQFLKSVHDRVNTRGGLVVARDTDRDHTLRRLAHMLSSRCVVRSRDLAGLPLRLRKRLEHRVCDE